MKYYSKPRSFKELGVKQKRKLILIIVAVIVLAAVIALSVSANTIALNVNYRRNNPAVSFSEKNLLSSAKIKAFGEGGVSISNAKNHSLNKLTDSDIFSYWAPVTGSSKSDIPITIEFTFSSAVLIDTLEVNEKESYVQSFRIEVSETADSGDETSKAVFFGDEIGDYRLCSFQQVYASKLRLVITAYKGGLVKNGNNDKGIKIMDMGGYHIGKPEGDILISSFEDITGIPDARPSTILGTTRYKAVREHYPYLDQVVITNSLFLNEAYSPLYRQRDLSISSNNENFIYELNNLKAILKRGAATYTTTLLIDLELAPPSKDKQDSLITALINLCKIYNFDGFNINSKATKTADEWKDFNDFCVKYKEYAEEHGLSYILSVSSPDFDFSDAAKQAIDQIQEYSVGVPFSSMTDAVKKYKRHDVINKVVFGMNCGGIDNEGNKLTSLSRMSDFSLSSTEVEFKTHFDNATYSSPSLVRDKFLYAKLWGAKGIWFDSIYYDYFIPLNSPGSLMSEIIKLL